MDHTSITSGHLAYKPTVVMPQFVRVQKFVGIKWIFANFLMNLQKLHFFVSNKFTRVRRKLQSIFRLLFVALCFCLCGAVVNEINPQTKRRHHRMCVRMHVCVAVYFELHERKLLELAIFKCDYFHCKYI